MSRFETLARRLVLCWALAGCGEAAVPASTTAEPTAQDPLVVYSHLQTDLARLRDLHVVQVDRLVIEGVETPSCYGIHPCPSVAAIPSVAAEYARQAPRLERLVALATEIVARESIEAPTDRTTADLAAINALRIVSVTQLVTAAPANNPLCYSLPCPEDIARADAENHRRAAIANVLGTEATHAGL